MGGELKALDPDFQIIIDGTPADPELKASVIGIRVTDNLERSVRFQIHLSDIGNKISKNTKYKPGLEVEIKMGYQGQLVSVCKAEVATMEMVLTPDGPTRVVLAGLGKGHSFTKGTTTKTYQDVKDSDLVSQVAQRNGLTAETDDSVVVHDFVFQNNLTDHEFVAQRAAIAGFYFAVVGNKLLFKKPKLDDEPVATLQWMENLGTLVQEINTYDQVSKVVPAGWDIKKAEQPQPQQAKKGDEYGKGGGSVTGASLVKERFGEVLQVVPVTSGQTNLLEGIAKAEFNRRAGNFVKVEGRINGDPKVRAGTVVEVKKAGKVASGRYFVVSTNHVLFVDTGYATDFQARRYAIKK